MLELEEGAKEIIELCQRHGSWLLGVRIKDVENKTAFCLLIEYRWLTAGYPNGVFWVTPEFVARLSK